MTTLAAVATTELSQALLEGMARTPLFEGASDETISRLAAQGVSRRFRRGTYLFHQGDDAPDVYFLVSGRVEISSLSSNGHRQLHTPRHAPVFGELGVLGDQPRSAAALALEETEAWRVSGPVLLDFLSRSRRPPARCCGRSRDRCCRRRRSSRTSSTWT